MKKTAIIIGGTGAIGQELIQLLINNSHYDAIKLFSRSSSNIKHCKIKEFLGDLFEFEKFENNFTGDEVYCCIGTTKKQTPNEEGYRKIDYGIPVAAAKLAKKNNIPTYLVVSSLGANKNSTTFYTKTKGEMENAIYGLGIKNTSVFRPSLLIRNTKETRFFEKIATIIMSVLDFIFIGRFKKYKAIKTITVAKAMILIANSNTPLTLYLSDEIEQLGNIG